MQFNNTTNKNGCMQYIESLCKLGDGGITNDTVLFKQITSYFNQSCKEVEIALLQVDKNWRWDDTNYTDFPIATIATIDLVDQQRDYTLPASTSGGNASTLWKINSVRIKGIDGLYYPISQLDPSEEETQAGSTYSGTPIQYRLIGNSIRLSPIPKAANVTLTGGLEIQFQRSGVDFTTSSTTEQPGFIDAYHELPCYKTAFKYLLPINTNLAVSYSQIFDTGLDKLKDSWSNRNDDNYNQILVKNRTSR